MTRALCGFFFVTLFVPALSAQDREYEQALARAQSQRPATLTSSSRIAPTSEPGIPLVIHGQVLGADGRTPVSDATVFAYHTDREGVYDKPGSGAHSWRLRGWARTDAQGRFEFATIRPGSYPRTSQPAHVHFAVYAGDARHHGGELEFDDDPLITAAQRAEDAAKKEFASIRPVRLEGKTQHVDVRLRINPQNRF